MMKSMALQVVCYFLVVAGFASAQSLSYSGTPALLNNVTLSMHGTPNQPYVLAASDSPGPTVVAPLGSFDMGYPPIIIAGAIPGLPVVPALDSAGNMSMTFNVPFNTSLIGTTWWFQGVYFDPSAPYGITKTNGTHFTIADPLLAPTVTSITPSSGPAAGGTQVAIMGTNFLPGGTTVMVGPNALLNPTIATPTLIFGTIPPGAPGSAANVTVTTLAGGASVLAGGFTYLGNSAPSIATISPTHAPITGGGIFTLSGQGLGAGTTVYLNGVPCIGLSQSPTSYVGIIPNTSTPGYATLVAVSTAGVSTLSNVFRYTIVLDVGNGSDGAFAPTSNTLIDTTLNGGVFNYTSFTIPLGVTVTARGPNPLVIKCQGDVTIAGTLDLKGEDGTFYVPNSITGSSPTSVMSQLASAPIPWPQPGPGGSPGGRASVTGMSVYLPGNGSYSQGSGPGAVQLSSLLSLITTGAVAQLNPLRVQPSHGTSPVVGFPYSLCQPSPYGALDLTPLTGGSGGLTQFQIDQPVLSQNYFVAQYVYCGSAGGGALDVRSRGNTWVTGIIDARGGSPPYAVGGCASAGATKFAALGDTQIQSSAIWLQGGSLVSPTYSYFAGDGRWAIRSWNGILFHGTESTVPPGTY